VMIAQQNKPPSSGNTSQTSARRAVAERGSGGRATAGVEATVAATHHRRPGAKGASDRPPFSSPGSPFNRPSLGLYPKAYALTSKGTINRKRAGNPEDASVCSSGRSQPSPGRGQEPPKAAGRSAPVGSPACGLLQADLSEPHRGTEVFLSALGTVHILCQPRGPVGSRMAPAACARTAPVAAKPQGPVRRIGAGPDGMTRTAQNR